MAPRQEAKIRPGDKLFDVTCVIGSVMATDDNGHSPHEAAFLLIAQHDASGTYEFPSAAGSVVRVTVEYENPPDSPFHDDNIA